jgi:hypothetical protein
MASACCCVGARVFEAGWLDLIIAIFLAALLLTSAARVIRGALHELARHRCLSRPTRESARPGPGRSQALVDTMRMVPCILQ